VRDASLIAPESYQLASAAIARIGVEPQMDLLLDYGSNVRQYPALHAYFRHYQPPTLAIWGKNDPNRAVMPIEQRCDLVQGLARCQRSHISDF
jgi:hypothetical protein